MHCWDSRIPGSTVGDEITPKLRGREPWRDNCTPATHKRRKKPGEKAMNVEERHDKKSSIRCSQIVSCLNIEHGSAKVPVSQRHLE